MRSKTARFTASSFAFFLAYFASSYPDVVFGHNSFAKRDILRYYYPMWQYGVQSMKAGFIPFWNPYHSFGKPFAANIQNCLFYPLQLILYLPDYTWAFNFYILVHLALAGTFTALWMRDLGVSRPGAWAAGFAFSVSGYMASAINLTISLCSAAYLPLALFFFRRMLHRGGVRSCAGLSLTLLFQYLAGDPSIFFSTLVVLSVFAVFKTAEETLRAGRPALAPMLRFFAPCLVFLGLAAFHYPMFYEFLKHTERSSLIYDWATMWSVQYNDLVGLAIPFFSDISGFFMDYWVRQSWMESYYAGATVLFLGACAVAWKRDRLRAWHLLLGLFGVALALGRFSGVYWFFNKFFPFFGLIRYPVRFMYLVFFAAACLAGFAVDDIWKGDNAARPRKTGGWRRLAPFLLFAGAAGVWATIAFSVPIAEQCQAWVKRWLLSLADDLLCPPALVQDMTEPVLENIKRTAVLVLLAWGTILAFRLNRLRGRLAAVFLFVLAAADLSAANTFEMRIHRRYMDKRGPHVSRVLEDGGLFRVFASGRLLTLQNMPLGRDIASTHNMMMQTFSPNVLMPFRIQDAGGYDSLFLLDSARYLDRRAPVELPPAKSRYLDLVNVKYFVFPDADLAPPAKLLRRGRPALYENARVLPRAFLVRRAVVEPEWQKALERLSAEDFDPLDTLLVSRERPWMGPDENPAEGRAAVTRYAPNEVEMDVESPARRWLFFSDTFFPGWRARVDGKDQKIVKANVAFRALEIAPGRHHVEWKYEPTWFRMGLAVSFLTALFLTSATLRSFRHGH